MMSQTLGYDLIKCPFCTQNIDKYTLENHIRFHHPDGYEYYVPDDLLNNPYSLADICEICDCRTRNIIEHYIKHHPDKLHPIFLQEER